MNFFNPSLISLGLSLKTGGKWLFIQLMQFLLVQNKTIIDY